MFYEWVLPDSSVISHKSVFTQRIPPIIEKILIDRNINNDTLLEKYINPKLTDSFDAFLMKDSLYTEEQLLDMGFTFTMQSYSKYLIYQKEDNCLLVDKLPEDQYRVHLDFVG